MFGSLIGCVTAVIVAPVRVAAAVTRAVEDLAPEADHWGGREFRVSTACDQFADDVVRAVKEVVK
jgi:hypothetical protein